MEGPRATKKEELDELVKLVNLVFRRDANKFPGMREQFPLLFCEENLDNLRIIVEDGKIVSHIGICQNDVSIFGCKTRVGSIGSVGTHPDYRGRGYATTILEDCVKKLNNDGCDIMLVSGRRGLYHRAHCVVVGKSYIFKINRDHLANFDDGSVEVALYNDNEIPLLNEIHQREPVRFFRSLENFTKLVHLDRVFRQEGKIREMLTLKSDGNLIAYVAIDVSEKGDEEKVRWGRIIEFAGARKAVVDAVPSLFERYKLDTVEVHGLSHDNELVYLLGQKGILPEEGTTWGHTIRIVNFRRLMENFRPYIIERIGYAQAGRLEFADKEENFGIGITNRSGPKVSQVIGHWIKNRSELVSLIFGTPEGKERDMIPKEGELREILDRIFPLPFVLPGLNYT